MVINLLLPLVGGRVLRASHSRGLVRRSDVFSDVFADVTHLMCSTKEQPEQQLFSAGGLVSVVWGGLGSVFFFIIENVPHL